MFYHFEIMPQMQRIFSKNQSLLDGHEIAINSQDKIADIYDGEIYKRLKREKKTFTFLFNTDGASIAKKSKLSLWPIYLCITELPSEKRYCIDNVIVAGKFLFPSISFYFSF